MRLEPPGWWFDRSGTARLKAGLLAPLGALYGSAVKIRFGLTKPYRSSLPVVCIGNFTMGGAGKTPLALAIAELLHELGHQPAFLTRGYGGRIGGPHPVDSQRDRPEDVGDEALLLVRAAPTVVSRIRPDGARAIEQMDASVIIMDDGFQNPTLHKDLSIIAVDAASGIGNGRVFPSGPLRAPFSFQTRRADAVVLIGEGGSREIAGLNGATPVLSASFEPSCDLDWLHAEPVLPFSGIGRPAKFFDMLLSRGAQIAQVKAFPDHHMYTDDDARGLLEGAKRSGGVLVTTEKDAVRISAAQGPLAELRSKLRVVPVKLIFDLPSRDQILSLLKRLPRA